MTCAGCNLIETACVVDEGAARCTTCPDVEARILIAFDIDGRRAAFKRIKEQRGQAAAQAVHNALTELMEADDAKQV